MAIPRCAVLLAGLLMSATAPAATEQGLVAHWDFSEGKGQTLHDRAGKHHGRIHGARWVGVGKGYALRFGGSGDYVDCGRVPALDLRGDFTIMTWIKLAASPFPDWNTNWTICNTEVLAKSGYILRVDGASSRVLFRTNAGKRYSGVTCGVALQNSTFYHLAVTKQGDVFRYYCDAALDAQFTKRLRPPAPATAPFAIGAKEQSFDGLIDDLKIFRRALSSGEIMAAFRKDAKAHAKDASWIGTLKLKLFDRFSRRQALCEVDFRGIPELARGESISVALHRKGGDVVASHTVNAIPESAKKDFVFRLDNLDEGDYEVRVMLQRGERVRTRDVVSFHYPPRPPVVLSPDRKKAPPLPPQPKVFPYKVEVTRHGGLDLTLGKERFTVDSLFSFPSGGDNGFLYEGGKAHGSEASWEITSETANGTTQRVTGEGAWYRVRRRIEKHPRRVVIKDTFTNKKDDPVGIIISHRIRPGRGRWKDCRLSGYAHSRGAKGRPISYNPTLFLRTADLGLGVIALDDVFIMQARGEYAPESGRLYAENFAVDGHASYTLEWALYPTASGSYYDFINQVRKDEGRNHVTLQGSLVTSSIGAAPNDTLLDRWGIKIVATSCLSFPPDDRGISLEGIEFIEHPKVRALLRKKHEALGRKHPDVKRIFHIAHSIYATNRPAELFPDSRVIKADGTQAMLGSEDYYKRTNYFSEQRKKEGWRWWSFYPTLENSFGKALLRSVDVMFDEMGAQGGFMDGFSHPYGAAYTYDKWDGHTADIDPRTKKITRLRGDLVLLSQDALIAFVRKINARGGLVVANNAVITRSIGRENIIVDKENQESPYVHLAQTPVSLGRYISTETDAYQEVLRKLAWGNLHFFYPGSPIYPCTTYKPTHRHVACRMYPITVQEIYAGCVKGNERLITMNSGVYAWPGDPQLHAVHTYDSRGWEVPHAFFTTKDNESVRTALELGKDEVAVVRKIPVRLNASAPVNVLCTRHDERAIQLIMNGRGAVSFTVGNGEFPVKARAAYVVTAKAARTCKADAAGRLTFDLALDGPVTVCITRAEKP